MSIVWNGVSSDNYGIVVEKASSLVRPSRKMSTISIPGRNGDLVIQQDAWNNYEQDYEIFAEGGSVGGVGVVFAGIASWLCGPKGYCRLEDVFEPDIFRLAYYKGPLDVENSLNEFGRATLEFDCKPQRFLKTGEIPISLTAPEALYNPGMDALPLITVYGSGVGTVTVGGVTVDIKSMDGYLVLDCDTQNAYKGILENKNNTISAPKFPTIPPGESRVGWTGGVTRVEIIPRWWTL